MRAVVVVGERQETLGQPDDLALVELRFLVPVARQADRGIDQERSEDDVGEGERLQRGRPDEDEDRPQHEGTGDTGHQHLLLVDLGYGEGAHDDDEHEEVVHRQALLDQPPGEVLQAVRPALGRHLIAAPPCEEHAVRDGDPDVDDRLDGGFPDLHLVRIPGRLDEFEGNQQHDDAHGDSPQPCRDHQCGFAAATCGCGQHHCSILADDPRPGTRPHRASHVKHLQHLTGMRHQVWRSCASQGDITRECLRVARGPDDPARGRHLR